MATVQTARTTANVGSRQIAIALEDRIAMLEPDINPLLAFSSKLPKKQTTAPTFYWVEDQHKARYDRVNGAVASTTATAIVVDHGAYFQTYDQVLISRTGEQLRIESVSSNTLTVTRGIGSTAANINDDDELIIIGSAQPENDRSKQPASNNPSEVSNFTQIFRTPFEASDTLRASGSQLTPVDWVHQNRLAAAEHAKDIEYSLLLGRKSSDTSGATPLRTTGGALSFISTNSTGMGGEMTETEWNAWLQTGLRYGSSRKVVFASGTALASLQKFPAGKLQVRQDETTYGINVTRFTSPFGAVSVVYHRLLEGDKYGGYAIMLDMDQITYRYLGNGEMSRDTKLLTNRQHNDQDGRKDEFLSEIGLQFGQERTAALATGITS